MKNFWQKLNKPIMALAPMAGISDMAWRQICKEYGADVLYSEMASATALNYDPEKTLELVKFKEKERPYVVQLFGGEPKHFIKATKIITKKIQPDGIDINFGCPVKKVQKQGAGAVLMKDLRKSRSIIETVIKNTDLPVSIKTRTRVGGVDVLQFLDFMKDLDIKAVMIHGRTLAQGFNGPIDTKIIKAARNHFDSTILANGGIDSYEEAQKILAKTAADGLGIARGALGRPWIFKALHTGQKIERSLRPIIKTAIKHAELMEQYKGKAGIMEMRKHLSWYVAGLPGAKKIRQELTSVNSIADIRKVLHNLDDGG